MRDGPSPWELRFRAKALREKAATKGRFLAREIEEVAAQLEEDAEQLERLGTSNVLPFKRPLGSSGK